MPLGFQISRLIGPFQAKQLGQGGRVADFQSQRVIGWIMALFLAGVIVVIASERKAAKNPLRLNGFPALAHFSGLGLIGGVNPVGRLLEKKRDDFIGRFENGGADQYLQLLRRRTIELLGRKAADQLLDFRVLGQD